MTPAKKNKWSTDLHPQGSNDETSKHTDDRFAEYLDVRASRTIRTHQAALVLWTEYLDENELATDLLRLARQWAVRQLSNNERDELAEKAAKQKRVLPIMYAAHFCQNVGQAWYGTDVNMVRGFVDWMLAQGYSIASVNNRLSAVKVYAKLAFESGQIAPDEWEYISKIRGYTSKQAKKIDAKREKTRVGYKKREAVTLTEEQLTALKKKHKGSPQGRRDRLLMNLLIDLGLRASEAAKLRVSDFEEEAVNVRRGRGGKRVDRIPLTSDVHEALRKYKRHRRKEGRILRGSRKSGRLTDESMSPRAIGSRVKVLGQDILGLPGLSPHDLRHSWAILKAEQGKMDDLKEIGGWSSPQTPNRYIEVAQSDVEDGPTNGHLPAETTA